MNVNNLSWEQIKELAEIAIKNGSDFSLMLCADGDCSIDISKHDYEIPQRTTTNPPITWNNPETLTSPVNIEDMLKTVKIGDMPNNPDYGVGIYS